MAGGFILDGAALEGGRGRAGRSVLPKVLPHVVQYCPSQGLLELHMVLPAPDTDEKNGLNLLRRLWVVKFDKEEEIRKLAER